MFSLYAKFVEFSLLLGKSYITSSKESVAIPNPEYLLFGWRILLGKYFLVQDGDCSGPNMLGPVNNSNKMWLMLIFV